MGVGRSCCGPRSGQPTPREPVAAQEPALGEEAVDGAVEARVGRWARRHRARVFGQLDRGRRAVMRLDRPACGLCEAPAQLPVRHTPCGLCGLLFCPSCLGRPSSIPQLEIWAAVARCRGCERLMEQWAGGARSAAWKQREKRFRQKEMFEFVRPYDRPAGQPWYLIHRGWLRAWEGWLAGGEHPGPITNHGLLREGELAGQPVVGLSRKGWLLLRQLYGGGPTVVADELELGGARVIDSDETSSHGSVPSSESDAQAVVS